MKKKSSASLPAFDPKEPDRCQHLCICGARCMYQKADHQSGQVKHLIPHGLREKDCKLTGAETRKILHLIFRSQGRKDDFHDWLQTYIQAAYQ